jgi:hypothetical protein
MTLNELIFNIKNIIEKGVTQRSLKITNAQVAMWFKYYRAKLISDILKDTRTNVSNYEQDLGCVELECVDRAECCDLRLEEGILRTKKRIPSLIQSNDFNGITFVGLIDKQTPIQFNSAQQAYWRKFSRFTKYKRTAFYMNDYIYISDAQSPTRLTHINIRGVFEDPEQAHEFNNCTEDCVDFYDSEFPMDGSLVPVINELIFTKELNIYSNAKEDNTNNGTDVR